jgi:hypothetical protein
MNSVAFTISPESVVQREFSWSHCRNEGIGKIVRKAHHDHIRHNIDREYKVRIWTADFPRSHYEKNPPSGDSIELETVSPDFKSEGLFPDFAFGNWSDMGLEDFDEFSREIRENNSSERIEDQRLFWTGSTLTSHNRSVYLGLCACNPEKLHGIAMNEWIPVDGGSRTEPKSFVPMHDHCRYKYLIDIAGYGYGSRIKFIPFCNRPMFVNERRHYTWSCVETLRHDLHIPVREDLSDLVEKVSWADQNEDAVFANAKRLLEICTEAFSFENVCRHAANVILSRIGKA